MQKLIKSDGIAKLDSVSAKPSFLPDGTLQTSETEAGVILHLLRVALRSNLGYPNVFLTERDRGYALFFKFGHHGPRVWLIAEHSKCPRIFKRADTAFALCRDLGLSRLVVRFNELDQEGV